MIHEVVRGSGGVRVDLIRVPHVPRTRPFVMPSISQLTVQQVAEVGVTTKAKQGTTPNSHTLETLWEWTGMTSETRGGY